MRPPVLTFPSILFIVIAILATEVSAYLLWKLLRHRVFARAFPPSIDRSSELTRFTDGLLHDLANPLTVISLNLESLIATLSHNSATQESSTQLIFHMQHAVSQMEQYLKSARHHMHGEEAFMWFEPVPEIEQVLLLFRHRAKLLNITLQTEYDSLDTLYGSPVQFARIITNLISNAIDAYENSALSSPKIITIQLIIIARSKALQLTVIDHGEGISAQNLKLVFEPFFTTKAVGKGSGMGLTIIKDIVKNHFRGEVKINSTVGEGTTIKIQFPQLRQKKN